MNVKQAWREWYISTYGKTSLPKLKGPIVARLYETWEAGWEAAKKTCPPCNHKCGEGRQCPAKD